MSLRKESSLERFQGRHWQASGTLAGQRPARRLIDSRLSVFLLFCRTFPHVLSNLHATEVRAAHTAKSGEFGMHAGQRLVVVFSGEFRIERQVELVLPAEFEPGFRKCIVPGLSAWMTLGQIGRMGSDLVGDQPFLHIIFIW